MDVTCFAVTSGFIEGAQGLDPVTLGKLVCISEGWQAAQLERASGVDGGLAPLDISPSLEARGLEPLPAGESASYFLSLQPTAADTALPDTSVHCRTS